MDRYRVGAHDPLRAIAPGVLEFKRRKPQHPFTPGPHAVGQTARIAKSVGLGACVVQLPVGFVDFAGKRRRMQRGEIGAAEKVYRKHQRIADLGVVHIEERAHLQRVARNAGKLHRRQNCRKPCHCAVTLNLMVTSGFARRKSVESP